MIQKWTKTNVSAFIDQLNTRRSEMDAQRIVMSDTDFGKLYNVSCCTVTNYMGYMKKNITYKSTIKTISKSEINWLRAIHSDTFIAKKYWCSLATINKHFGSREELWLPKHWWTNYKNNTNAKKIYKDSISAINSRLEATKVPINGDRWVYKVEKPYWMTDDLIVSGDNPHPFIYNKLS
jgi:hypothetical protein